MVDKTLQRPAQRIRQEAVVDELSAFVALDQARILENGKML